MNNKLTKLVLVILFILFWRVNCCYATVRAMWVTRFQMDSKEKIDDLVDLAQKYDFDTLFVQVVGRGQAYYHSTLLPRIELDFDPLEYTVEKSHNKGIQVHAWLNAYYVWSSPEAPSDLSHVLNQHPDWVLDSSSAMKFLDPANPRVKNYLKKMYLEVAQNYDVDGIHFDYIRYDNSCDGLSRHSRKQFSDLHFIDPYFIVNYPVSVQDYYGKQGYSDLTFAWSKFKRDCVYDLVKDTSFAIHKARPDIQISAAVYQVLDEAKRLQGQDWPLWLREGLIDFAVPMLYTKNIDLLTKRIKQTTSAAEKKSVVIGLGPYLTSVKDFSAQYALYKKMARLNESIVGFSLFSYDVIKDDPAYLKETKQ